MRDDVLVAELRDRLGTSEAGIRQWFDSLQPAHRGRVVELMDAQIADLQDRPGQDAVRNDQLKAIRTLFTAWMGPVPG